jgi:hypothetical protein
MDDGLACYFKHHSSFMPESGSMILSYFDEVTSSDVVVDTADYRIAGLVHSAELRENAPKARQSAPNDTFVICFWRSW